MAEEVLPVLPPVIITGQTPSISDYAWWTYANQPDWVQIYSYLAAARAAIPPAPPRAPTPPPPSHNPDEPTLDQLYPTEDDPGEDPEDFDNWTDQQLQDEGTDSALDELARRQGYSGLEEANFFFEKDQHDDLFDLYVGPAAIPQTPTSPAFRGSPSVRPGVPGNWPFEPAGPQIGDPDYVYRTRPPPKVEPLPSPFNLLRLLPWLTLFVPQSMGPRAFDEAPEWWDLPPLRVKPGPTVTPITFPFSDPSPIDLPVPRHDYPVDPGPRVRPVLPISDNPGVFADPVGLPDLPLPFPDVKPGPRTAPAPRPTAPEPFGDPFPDVRTDPRTPTLPQPRTPPGPYQYPGTPFPPGDFFFDPLMPPVPFAPPPGVVNPPSLAMPPPDPFTLLPTPRTDRDLPDSNDPCNCNNKKKKKKKDSKGRDVCYRGTYVEYEKGQTKTRLKVVPCKPKKESRLGKTLGKIRRAKKRKSAPTSLIPVSPFNF